MMKSFKKRGALTHFQILSEISKQDPHLKQKDLANKIGVSHTNIYNYEVGRTEPSIEMLIKLSDALGVSVGFLVGAEDEDGGKFSVLPSEKELKLLNAFRRLEPFEQETVLTQITALCEKKNKSVF